MLLFDYAMHGNHLLRHFWRPCLALSIAAKESTMGGTIALRTTSNSESFSPSSICSMRWFRTPMTSFFFWGPGSFLNFTLSIMRRPRIGGISSLVKPSSMYSDLISSTVLMRDLASIFPANFLRMTSIFMFVYYKDTNEIQ